jgi:hypothetical protein
MANQEALHMALGERLRETLPADEFEVVADAQTLTIRAIGSNRHQGSALSMAGGLMLHLPLPTDLRVRTYFENQADSVQEFVSKVAGRDWPAAGAKPHAKVTQSEVHVWYGSGDEESAPSLGWRPFSRAELGL